MGQTSSFLRNLKLLMVNIFSPNNYKQVPMTQPQITVFKMTTLYKVAIYLFSGDAGMINLMVVELFFSTDSNLQSII